MIQVIDNGDGVEIPAEIAELCGSDAPAYLIINPKESPHSQAEVEREIRNAYKKELYIIFTGYHKLADGRIVSVGQKIPAVIAHRNLTARERNILFGGNTSLDKS